MSEIMVRPGVYEHYKGEKYKVIGVARFSEDPQKEFVVYEQLYGSDLEGKILPTGTLWVRPKEMFIELVDGVRRFRRIDE